MNKIVYLIGRLPPPIGGVSVFLKRLKNHMETDGISNVFIDISGVETVAKKEQGIICMGFISTFFWLMFKAKAIVVFHSNRFPVLIGAYLLSYRHKIVIFTHGESILKRASRLKHFLLKRTTAIVAPIDELAERIKLTYPELCQTVHSVPFILYPTHTNAITEKGIVDVRNKHKIMISAYAYDVTLLNNVDLYGVDMLVELMAYLKSHDYNIGMVLLLPACSDTPYSRQILAQIDSKGLNDMLYVHKHSLDEASDLFAMSDLYLRPSSSDGDSFAIWEALHFGTPVIASDVVERPHGCYVFENRNQDSLNKAVVRIIDNLPECTKKTTEGQYVGSESKIYGLFKKL